jgi:hypothetical protein
VRLLPLLTRAVAQSHFPESKDGRRLAQPQGLKML